MGSRRVAGAIPLAATLLGAAVAARAAEEPAPAAFAWKGTYGEALSAALRRRTPFVLYFPPIDPAAEPPVARLAPRALGTPPIVEGARVGADEIVDLKQRFRVMELPAVLFVDRRGNVVHRWEGRIPANLWALVETLVRRVEKREAEDGKVAAEGLALAAAGDAEGAYRKVVPLLESERTDPETLARARAIEAKVLSAGRRRMLEALSLEGLAPDADLVERLASLMAREVHPRIRAEIGREIDRVRERRLGARGVKP
jgi:hypothetical protein